MPDRTRPIASSPTHVFSQVPPSVRLRIGPPRPPTGGPFEGAIGYSSWPTPRTRRDVRITQDSQGAYWLSEASIGEVRLAGESGLIEAWPSPRVRPRDFLETVFFDWLPAIYTRFGWWVLRASSVWRIGSASAVAFAGDRRCGKSTLARAIGMRPGWGQLSDDTLAFDMLGAFPRLLPMPNRVRLEPPASLRLEHDPAAPVELSWPATTPNLEAIYLLSPSSARASRAEIKPVSLNEAHGALLGSARRLAISDGERQQQLAEAVRELVTSVRVFRLTYSRNSSQIRSLTNGVSQHVLSVIRQAESLRGMAADLAAPPVGPPATSDHAA
jgi:hypothetical protein